MARLILPAVLLALSALTPALAAEQSPVAPPGLGESPEAIPSPSPDPAPLQPPEAGAKPGDPGAFTGKPKSLGVVADKRRAVDDLLGRLARTEDPATAKRIAAAIQAFWQRSGSDTVDLLTSRASEALRSQNNDVASKLLDEVVSLKPDYAEGWNRRAAIRFQQKDFDEAMGDLHQTLIREPRHFIAWLGLGRILLDAGLDKQALAAFRKVQEIYPAMEGVKKEVDELTLKVEGQPI